MKEIYLAERLNSEQAELTGIMFGDGSMQRKRNHTYIIEISGNSCKDKEHFNYIKSLF